MTLYTFFNLFSILPLSLALKIISGGSLPPSAVVVNNTDIWHFS